MIQHIHIENYTLIDKLSIDFEEGFSVITGETGAGKSILIGALSLLLGQRADTSVLFDKDKKSIVEASFRIKDYQLSDFFHQEDLDYEDICIIRREITPQGKSRAFINDTPVNISLLKQIGDRLVDIHSQHNNLLLQDTDFQLLIIDQYAQLSDKVNEYNRLYRTYQSLKKQLQEILQQSGNQDKEYYDFLYNELEEAKLVKGEQDELEQRNQLLSNAEEIKLKLGEIVRLMDDNEINAMQLLQDCRQRLTSLEKHAITFTSLSERFNATFIELQDIAKEIVILAEETIYDPQEIEKINSRLDTLNRLEQKHKANNEDELIIVKEQLSQKLEQIHQTELSVVSLREKIASTEKTLFAQADYLSLKRKDVLSQIETAIKEKLKLMNMSKAEIKIVMEKNNHLTENGLDKPTFLFNANKGTDMQAISKIASGGELSRLMLAIKSLVLRKNVLPTIIFDEIDTGVSGEVSAKMGKVMQEIAHFSQVIAITHLPQIASKSTVHYLVYKQEEKTKTYSHIKRLSQEERVVEIAKMISNEEVSESSLQAAKTLLNS